MNNRPKRKKSSDNPYTLQIINNNYVVVFKDSRSAKQVIEVSEEVFNQMNKFELEDISQMHKIDKHIERFKLSDESINNRAKEKPNDTTSSVVEELLINNELYIAINSLSEKQKKRIKMFYFDGLSQQEIAKIENTSIRAIQYTLNNSLKKLKENLKKIKN